MRKPGKGRAVFHYVLKDVSRIKVSAQKEKEKKMKRKWITFKWLLMHMKSKCKSQMFGKGHNIKKMHLR